ncbi:NAD(P)/FAD-dependent oxidoreductase [Sphingomonas sp. C3-2]|uniref:NAD(P)/FAD-dependent oxidoreductase n=1 Tax=Sphingomonas sp. C3-2 TaxID=3062169 RepID=UPI00294B5740|nr:NAD(P)/FAD-dependent oxidoreductase [Sphingomonas sp. C3-2]WOK36121.1 NAD(P)/FAD-dependent oxidoreductase [Sphingomonas sp. C3-2]
MAFAHLLKPGRIGPMELRNRIFMTPMGSNLAEDDGISGDRLRVYYEARARGGAALITMGSVSVGYPDGSSNWRQEAISDERHVPGVRAIADAVHAHGAKLAVQLHHAGLVAMNDMLAGRPIWTPSAPAIGKADGDMMDGFLEDELAIFAAPYATMGEPRYRIMDHSDIRQIVDMFARAAVRAQRAGVDAIELHAGHGYLISAFLNPLINTRDDAYGGSIENRARFLCDVIRGVRAAVGPDMPIWPRIDSQHFLIDGGVTVEDAAATARLAEDAGADAIHVSADGHPGRGLTYSTGHATDVRNGFIDAATRIRAAVDIPVICPGRIEPEDGDRFIREGRIDFITMGRKLLADPELPGKLAAGRAKDVRPCIYCYTCISQIFFSRPVKCAVNPETGFERERALTPAAKTRRIVVVGGGPAGMEAARRLALQGHTITLMEASGTLGGTARFASIAYAPNGGIVDWLRRQVAALPNITVQLHTEATLERVRQINPDHVVMATGARRAMPPIPGADQDFVFNGDEMRSLMLAQNLDALSGKIDGVTRMAVTLGRMTGLTGRPGFVRAASRHWMPLGDRIVIIGGELVGMELAEFLAQRGRKVTIVDPAARPGAGLQVVRRWRVLDELNHLGVTMLSHAQDIAIGDHTVSYANPAGQIRTLAADHVIVAQGATGDLRLADAFAAAGLAVHAIGDAKGVGYIEGAMQDAAELARTLEGMTA